jgi:L-ribulose-5-phosphate 4-epimerase
MTICRWQEEKKKVLDVSRKMLEKGLVVGTTGNASMRLPPEADRQLLAITPSSRHYDSLDIDDIQILDFESHTVEGKLKPSMETGLHIGIYLARPDVNAVIHTHSVYASAVSVAGMDIPPILDDQVAFLGGEIKAAGYARTGSKEQIDNVMKALGDRNAVLLRNHGAVGTGVSLLDAFTACELIEKTSRIYLLALSTGNVKLLPSEAIEAEKELYYGIRRNR